jgi:hyperosmotically inducible protein
VSNGAVTLGGHARTDVDKDSALALISTYPGVKEVENEIQVDPVSIMDDQTRMAVARAVYGYPTLNKYAIDPAKTIRISVQNGHVELYGVVDDPGRQGNRVHPRQRRPGRVQREELPAGSQPGS